MNNFRIKDLSKARLIDSSKPIRFSFDGKEYQGFAGDSVASSLLAAGIRTVGRSFKYHRRRGVMASNESEANAMATLLHKDASREPNVKLPCLPLSEGLQLESQNRFPSLEFDILSVNNLFSKFMPAGFYYKTFIGPLKKSWMWYEPIIRKAAGLGTANYEADKDEYDNYSYHPDILVIGSGISGLTAAYQASLSGVKVLLMEQFPDFGGRLLAEAKDSEADIWLKDILAKLQKMPNVKMVNEATLFGWYDHNILAAYEKKKGEKSAKLWKIYASSVILASGAMERPIAFGNNDLPNIMLSSALRFFANAQGVIPGKDIVIFANDDEAYASAFDIKALAEDVKISIIDARGEDEIGKGLLDNCEKLGIVVQVSHVIVNATGRKQVEACHIAAYDSTTGAIGSIYQSIKCDLIATAGGFTPTLHLHSQIGAKPKYNDKIHAFQPQPEAAKGHFCVGSCLGIYGSKDKIEQAQEIAKQAIKFVGGKPANGKIDILEKNKSKIATPIFYVAAAQGDKQGKVFLDFQNDVSLQDVKIANLEGCSSVEHMKRYTTLGMATDQGKTSNMAAFHILAALQGKQVEQLGTTTFRPPYTGVPIGAFAGRQVGKHFRPLRKIPLHDWHLAKGAKMINSVAWQRPWYYPKTVEDDVVSAYVREMTHVRNKVGLSDVSTLGKIMVMGPDAAEFLDRIYINGFKKLAIGKCRYGVMLRDDGFVLDDGTVTRLSENEYFMTTTTVEAEVVYRRLEFLLDVVWSDLKVHVVSVSDEWCGLALAGKQARDVLQALVNEDVSDEALPFMSYKDASLKQGKLSVRIFRISFSGELGYEIYIPRFQGEALADACMEAGKAFGLGLYGLEALGALRIEKGFLTSAEIDGRHSLKDLGLDKMASSKKPYLGGALSERDVFQDENRPRLVGLKALDVNTKFRNGSLIYSQSGDMKGHGLGYITSVTWSPFNNCYIALAFISGEVAKGSKVRVSYPLKNEAVSAEVVATDFLGDL